jgi:hypothetical protein
VEWYTYNKGLITDCNSITESLAFGTPQNRVFDNITSVSTLEIGKIPIAIFISVIEEGRSETICSCTVTSGRDEKVERFGAK